MQFMAVLVGTGLLAYLVLRAGSDKLIANAKSIGWGILLVIALAGIAHLVKTWAWRLTLPSELRKVPFSRMLGLRLASEAIGQLGFVGQLVGDAARASLLTSDLPVSSIVSSVALDRVLFMLSGLVVTIVGLTGLMFRSSLPAKLRLFGSLLAIGLLVLLLLAVLAFRRGWPVLSGSARVVRRVPKVGEWLRRKESVIQPAEQQLYRFHADAPAAFWVSTALNFVTHALAIAEVYLILLLMGSKISFAGALMLEALTKLINAAGTVNPGNVGTYEGGNMAIVKIVGLTATAGLSLGLCRRFRSLVWALVGGVCLMYLSRSKRSHRLASGDNRRESKLMLAGKPAQKAQQSDVLPKVAIILANEVTSYGDLKDSTLAEVGALPLVLRAILNAKALGADRVVVVVDPVSGPAICVQLAKTRRVPDNIEWLEVVPDSAISEAVRQVAGNAEHVLLIAGDRSYHPSVYRKAFERNIEAGALELVSDGKLVGITVLSHELVLDMVADRDSTIGTLEDLVEWIRHRHAAKFGPTVVYCESVPEQMWQEVASERDREAAEQKLDSWLVKPTDGIFARMNRRVSIPISRQLIKYPITPNMVSLFTLALSFVSGLYFAFGGYWNTVFAAVLSVWGSILDGCDGEVARLKLQASDFGCWLDSICDYLYYIFTFVGMTVGLARSTGRTSYFGWGGMLLLGAIATFVLASLGRKRLAGQRPEQYLAVWQKKAESQMSNPLAYIGRHTEFIVRRCFLPYAILGFALLNATWIPICVGAVGANLAWVISGYSLVAFSRKETKSVTLPGTSAAAASI